MLDRLFLPGLLALTALIVALAMVWPQGLGDRSPPPFGHAPVQRAPQVQAAMKAETEASERRLRLAREAVAALKAKAHAPAR